MRAPPSPLLVVTDRKQAARPLDQTVAAAVAGGARWVWLRDRDLDPAERRRLAFRLADIVGDAGGVLSVGGDAALAAEVGAGAVHLRSAGEIADARRLLGPAALVGVSAHGLADVAAARAGGADYATLSPIHATESKPGYGPALGLAALAQAARSGLPVLALGGIDAGNAADARRAGAAGAAVMGPVMRATEPAATIAALMAALAGADTRS